MAIVRPFRAVRPTPDNAAHIAAVPYDVVDTEEARALAAGNPLSFLHVSRAEIDLPSGADPHSDRVYRLAAERYRKLKHDAPLVQEASDSMYLYQLHVEGHTQTGIAACFSLEEYDGGAIKKHERTRRDKEDDRTRHMVDISYPNARPLGNPPITSNERDRTGGEPSRRRSPWSSAPPGRSRWAHR